VHNINCQFGIRNMLKIAENILEKVVDVVLISVYFNLEFPKYARGKRWKIGSAVESDLENFNYRSLKQALNHLTRNGFIQSFKDSNTLPQISESGKKRLNSIIPFYDEKRIWNGKLYLVAYDLPREKNNTRNKLRLYLKKIGCGMLQQSIWLTPYNPTTLLREFLEEKGIGELVIISSIGKDGAIGDFDQKELIQKVYNLSNLNNRYGEFIKKMKEGKLSRGQGIFLFLSILNVDPQLPFSLLPEDWLGQKAYNIFRKIKAKGNN